MSLWTKIGNQVIKRSAALTTNFESSAADLNNRFCGWTVKTNRHIAFVSINRKKKVELPSFGLQEQFVSECGCVCVRACLCPEVIGMYVSSCTSITCSALIHRLDVQNFNCTLRLQVPGKRHNMATQCRSRLSHA